MKVLLSWSGERSRLVATALRTWLSDVNQALQPWMSAEDIGKGQRWAQDLAHQLYETDVGIICVTSENMLSPWILFESGALSKALTNSLVCTYLVGLTPETLSGPLSLFQATSATQDDTRRLVHSLNDALGADKARPRDQIDRSFNAWWPQLQSTLRDVEKISRPEAPRQQDREVLDEILAIVRASSVRTIDRAVNFKHDSVHLAGLFDGDDVQRLIKRLGALGPHRDRDSDENANAWAANTQRVQPDQIEGTWHSRWNGGAASDRWSSGMATCIAGGDYVIFLFEDHAETAATYALICRREKRVRLVGRYVNLDRPEESTPWVGIFIDNQRIDGYWTEGRWDFRRQIKAD